MIFQACKSTAKTNKVINLESSCRTSSSILWWRHSRKSDWWTYLLRVPRSWCDRHRRSRSSTQAQAEIEDKHFACSMSTRTNQSCSGWSCKYFPPSRAKWTNNSRNHRKHTCCKATYSTHSTKHRSLPRSSIASTTSWWLWVLRAASWMLERRLATTRTHRKSCTSGLISCCLFRRPPITMTK